MSFGIGQPVPRVEDPRLVTGGGRFTDDMDLPGQLYAAFFRSPHAHGRIVHLDGRRGRRPGSLPFRTGSYTDYDIPRADHVPDIDMTFNEVLEPTDYRGVKGICEGGACGAPRAVVHAALTARGVWRRGPWRCRSPRSRCSRPCDPQIGAGTDAARKSIDAWRGASGPHCGRWLLAGRQVRARSAITL